MTSRELLGWDWDGNDLDEGVDPKMSELLAAEASGKMLEETGSIRTGTHKRFEKALTQQLQALDTDCDDPLVTGDGYIGFDGNEFPHSSLGHLLDYAENSLEMIAELEKALAKIKVDQIKLAMAYMENVGKYFVKLQEEIKRRNMFSEEVDKAVAVTFHYADHLSTDTFPIGRIMIVELIDDLLLKRLPKSQWSSRHKVFLEDSKFFFTWFAEINGQLTRLRAANEQLKKHLHCFTEDVELSDNYDERSLRDGLENQASEYSSEAFTVLERVCSFVKDLDGKKKRHFIDLKGQFEGFVQKIQEFVYMVNALSQ